MSRYYLKVLNTTSTDSMSCREQSFEKTVEADGYWLEGDGRVYVFWEHGEGQNEKNRVACYPTNCTIIERINHDKSK